jgi:hypothetical protein
MKSRMWEIYKYGSVRGGAGNCYPSTRHDNCEKKSIINKIRGVKK